MNFDTAFEKLIGHEGGYVNHPSDPGGETNWGITVAVAREHGYTGSMQAMPIDVAKAIYRKTYWGRCDELPEAVRYAFFDSAVNSGTVQAIKWMQRAVGAVDDGVLGPKTMLAVQTQNGEIVRRKMLAQRLRFMSGLSTWPAFGRGWARRIADLLEA